MTENFFKLLIPLTKSIPIDIKTIELAGNTWMLVDFDQISDAPPYTCVSYSWGIDRSVNPLNNKEKISNRTIPVIETVIKSFNSPEYQYSEMKSLFSRKNKLTEKIALAHEASHAIWIDALCCPQQEPNFDICIKKMGKIYEEATQVFVVLNTNCFETLYKIQNKKELNISDYRSVVDDNWIDRVWTYQEAMNSKMMFFLSENKEEVLISELNFLNSLMTYESVCKDIQDIDLYQKIERIQFLIVSLQLDGLSAFQLMTVLNKRFATYQEDFINAMISAVEIDMIHIDEQNLLSPVEYFIHLCEKNNDYSFIFSTNPRSKELGKTWYPIDTGNKIKPILSHISLYGGNGLLGYFKNTHLELHHICRMIPWKNNSTINIIEDFMKVDFPKELLKQLRQRGFTGCGDCLKLEYGYFFPQSSHKRSKDLFVAISHDIRFSSGAPGLLLRSNNTDINQFCDIGVFIGKLPKSSETLSIS